VLEGAPQEARRDDRSAVVREGGRPRGSEVRHLRELLPELALADRGHEAGGHESSRAGLLDERPENRSRVDDRIGVRHREDRAVPARRRCSRARANRLLVLAARRAQVDVWVDERRRDHERPRARRLDGGDHAIRYGDAQRLVDSLRRRDDAAREARGIAAPVAREERHATPTRSDASTGATVRTSYSTAIRTTRPARTWSVTRAASESATRASISTPRFIGPGCITTCPSRNRTEVIP